MPGFDVLFLIIARANKKRKIMTTKDDAGDHETTLTSSSSTTFVQVTSPVLQAASIDGVATMSAFEITSVSDTATLETEEVEGNLAVTSRDAEEMKSALGRVDMDSNRMSSSSGDSENPSGDLENNIDHLTGESHFTTSLSIVPSNPSPKPPPDTNGPLQGGASRFRRVNQYQRGRWSVRDTHEPEERPESESKVALQPDVPSSNSPSQVRKYPPPSSLTTSEYTYDPKMHSRSNSEASFITEPHISFVHVPRDTTGTLSDKSSVMADTNPSLSRTESNSSLIAKSLDEDGERESRSRDLDVESNASIPNTHTPDLQSLSGTYTSIDRPSLKQHCEVCSRRSIQDLSVDEQCQAVESTMDLLKTQLTQILLHNSPFQSLLKEKEELFRENTRLKERIKELESTIVASAEHRATPITTTSNASSSSKGGELANHSNPH